MSQRDFPLPEGIEYLDSKHESIDPFMAEEFSIQGLKILQDNDGYKLAKAAPMAASDVAFSPNFECALDAPLPDVWTQNGRALVSERFKCVIQSVDDWEHQFELVDIYRGGVLWSTGQQYYRLKVLRRVVVEKGSRIRGKAFDYTPLEAKVMGAILRDDIKVGVSMYPIWQVNGRCWEFYINCDVYAKLVEAGVTGIDLYSTYEGERGEGAVLL